MANLPATEKTALPGAGRQAVLPPQARTPDGVLLNLYEVFTAMVREKPP